MKKIIAKDAGWLPKDYLKKRGVPILPDPRAIKTKKSAKRGSAKEAKSIQHKRREGAK